MWAITRNEDDRILFCSDEEPTQMDEAGIVIEGHSLGIYNSTNATLREIDEADIPAANQKATYDGTTLTVVETAEIPAAEDNSIKYLYAHIEFSGGDGLDPIGIETSEGDDLAITVTIMDGEDSDTANTVTALSGKWRFTLRNEAGGIYDVIGATFSEGVAAVTYKGTRAEKRGPAIVSFLESDLTTASVGDVEYKFHIVGDTTFKAYEDA